MFLFLLGTYLPQIRIVTLFVTSLHDGMEGRSMSGHQEDGTVSLQWEPIRNHLGIPFVTVHPNSIPYCRSDTGKWGTPEVRGV